MEYKTPAATLDFEQDWSSWLASGDSISTSAWTLETGLTLDSDTIVSGNTSTRAIISGGTAGKVYKVENTITTANGLEETMTWFVTAQTRLV